MARTTRRRAAVPLATPAQAPAHDECDVLVVGGGINGTGIARDLTGRGLRTVLCEQDDLASHTSSASTKLVHGGLRYLEFYDFGLVRKSLIEREVILSIAPHLARPLRFVVPHDKHLRPAWMIRAGLFLYDHLAWRRRLPGSEIIDLRKHPAGAALEERYTTGFVYSDGWVDDSRLVVANAIDVRERGGHVLTRTKCVGLRPGGRGWRATLEARNGERQIITARLVVNAAGPWVAQFLDEYTTRGARHHPRLIQGSHIVVPKLFDHPYAYLFQGEDGRVVFAIPFEREFTLVGTTEREYSGDPARAAVDAAEAQYLIDMANRYFRQELTPRDIVWSYTGVRPLIGSSGKDPKRLTRDYLLDFDRRKKGPPLLSVYGGKLTTYRKLAEEVGDRVCAVLGVQARAWTAHTPLPGGDMPGGDFERFRKRMMRRYAWLDRPMLQRFVRAYGTRIDSVLETCTSMADLGEIILPGLTEREVEYLRRAEFSVTAEDILYRRSKLGVHLPAWSVPKLERFLEKTA